MFSKQNYSSLKTQNRENTKDNDYTWQDQFVELKRSNPSKKFQISKSQLKIMKAPYKNVQHHNEDELNFSNF